MAAVLDVTAVDIGRDVKQTRKCFGEPLPRHDDLNVHRGTERDTLLQVPHRILRQVAQDTRGLVDQNENCLFRPLFSFAGLTVSLRKEGINSLNLMTGLIQWGDSLPPSSIDFGLEFARNRDDRDFAIENLSYHGTQERGLSFASASMD